MGLAWNAPLCIFIHVLFVCLSLKGIFIPSWIFIKHISWSVTSQSPDNKLSTNSMTQKQWDHVNTWAHQPIKFYNQLKECPIVKRSLEHRNNAAQNTPVMDPLEQAMTKAAATDARPFYCKWHDKMCGINGHCGIGTSLNSQCLMRRRLKVNKYVQINILSKQLYAGS